MQRYLFPMFVALFALAVLGTQAAAEVAAVLAYEAPNGIHLINADGSGDHLVHGSLAGDQNPAWSPDGRRLALVFAKIGMAGRIVVIDVASGRRTLVPAGASADSPLRHAEFPSWSRDGASIFFNTDAAPEYAVHPDGTGLKLLLNGRYAYLGRVGPDGAFAYTDNSGSLVVVPRNGKARVLYRPRNDGDAWSLSWAADGNSLVFDTNGDSSAAVDNDWGVEIHRIGIDGQDDTRLTNNHVRDGDPDVSPDGSAIAFDTGRFGWDEIELMNGDGSQQHRLTHELHGEACCPDWRP
jgi:Tol biopolymer transport system component